MEDKGIGLLIGLVFSLILLAGGIFFMIKPSMDRKREYNNILKIANTKCVLICRYISGLPDLTEHIPCYMFADDEKITIIPTNNKNVKITLQISKIKKLEHIPFVGAGNLLIPREQGENDSIIIQYESENGEIKELTFSLDVNVYESRFNNYSASECNLIPFVRNHLKKEKLNIEL